MARVHGVISTLSRRRPVATLVRPERPAPDKYALAASCTIVALLVIAHVANRLTFDAEILRLDAEANVPTWFSSLQFGLAGIACLAVAAVGRDRLWALTGSLMLLLSLDELATLHERLSARIGGTVAEWIVQPTVGVAVIALLVATARRAGGRARTLLLAAPVALVAGHLAELATPPPEEGPVAASLKIVEESMEMLLGALVLAAAVRLLPEAVVGRGEVARRS